MAKISVVIPLFNKERYIKRTINSVLNQTMQDFEIIVVDDGSTDRSVEIVKQIQDERIRLIHKSNGGVSSARNYGIINSNTDLIAFLDSDDIWKPHYLETIDYLVQKYPNCGIYGTSYLIKSRTGILKKPIFYLPDWFKEGIIPNYFESAIEWSPVNASSLAIPKKIFEEIGMFNEKICLGEDLDMWGRIAIKYPVAFSRKEEVIYNRDHINSLSNNKAVAPLWPFLEQATKLAIKNNRSKKYIESVIEYVVNKKLKAVEYFIFIRNDYTQANILLENTKKTKRQKIRWTYLKVISWIFQILSTIFGKVSPKIINYFKTLYIKKKRFLSF